MFLCTIDGQKAKLVCSSNDTLACSRYIVLIISSFSGIVNFMCLVMLVAACLLVLCSLGNITMAQWAQ